MSVRFLGPACPPRQLLCNLRLISIELTQSPKGVRHAVLLLPENEPFGPSVRWPQLVHCAEAVRPVVVGQAVDRAVSADYRATKLLLVNYTGLHDEPHVLECAHIAQRIALHGDYIRPLASVQRTGVFRS